LAESAATVVQIAKQPVSERIVSAPSGAAAPSPAPAKRGPMIFVGLAIVVLLVGVAGVGGFILFKSRNTASSVNAENKPAVTNSVPATKEFGRYWLELLQDSPTAKPQRVAGAVPLASKQKLRLHFQFEESGYVYIVGPGEQNQPTAFLTAKPIPESGLSSNQVTRGASFSFPAGAFEDGVPRSLTLDGKPGTEQFTVVFSPTLISSPAFFARPVTGEPLSEADKNEWNEFSTKYGGTAPVTELNDKNGAEPFILLKAARTNNAGSPVVFQIRIEHK
jgi:hypothetical protein